MTVCGLDVRRLVSIDTVVAVAPVVTRSVSTATDAAADVLRRVSAVTDAEVDVWRRVSMVTFVVLDATVPIIISSANVIKLFNDGSVILYPL